MEFIELTTYKWLKEAQIFNKNNRRVPSEWLEKNADIIVLYFSENGVDKNGIIQKFYELYENAKFLNNPIEVINIPMDGTEAKMRESYGGQANWFTLKFHDTLVQTLRFMYEITSTPRLLVRNADGTIISRHGISDLETHGKNAILTWLSHNCMTSKQRYYNREYVMYGDRWDYMTVDPTRKRDVKYSRKFSRAAEHGETTPTPSKHILKQPPKDKMNAD
ncbi:uncharacterized protein LOC121727309 [Aricia agestis]|uniref:uncharacterized protein LOC121727309 n=1 Tax=Aricia agestis TaxID=91739 RepID=UPI001C20195E|nr:uncharacterized protein LOC121727309 [Aricia agestis]